MNQASKGYDRKKQLFQIVRMVSYAKGFLNMDMVVGLSILNDPNFKVCPSCKPCTLAVRAKKLWFCDKGKLTFSRT